MKAGMNRKKAYRILDVVLPFVTLAIVAIAYTVASKIVNIEMIAPSIPAVCREFFDLFGKPGFYMALVGTLSRAAAAYAISIVFAALSATLTKVVRPLKNALYPIVLLIRVLPTMSIILLVLIWFDDSNVSAVIVAFCIVFPMLYTSFCDAADGVDKDLVEMSDIYGVDAKTRMAKLYIPQMLPSVFTGIRSTAGLNLKLVIAAEVLAQTPKSIGLNMQLANVSLDTAQLLAWTVVAVVLGAVIEGIVALIEKKAVRGR